MPNNNRLKNKTLFLIILTILDFFLLGAILGQVDFQINCFYNPKNNWWQFPWGRYSAIFTWEQEYFIIFMTAVIAFVLGYFIAKVREER